MDTYICNKSSVNEISKSSCTCLPTKPILALWFVEKRFLYSLFVKGVNLEDNLFEYEIH